MSELLVSDHSAKPPESVLTRDELGGSALLRLARRDRAAAKRHLSALAPSALAGLCQELRPEVRCEFLMLLENPEEVVPLLPEAELCFAIRAGGMSDAAWLLEMASPHQRVACVDLDVWNGPSLDLERLDDWVDALMEAGRPTLVRTFDEIDPELWVLALGRMADIVLVGRDDEPPDGFSTEDGVVYFRAASDAQFARVREILQAAFSDSQSRYWQFVYGCVFELPSECEDYALRWRNGRLADLGFPDLDHAMRVYRPLTPETAQTVDVPAWTGLGLSELVASSRLPRQLHGTLVGEALGRLSGSRATDVLGYVLGVANAIAVADGLRLSDTDSIPRALEKAVSGIDTGLRLLAENRGQPPEEILECVTPLNLFRVGATQRADLERPRPAAGSAKEGEPDDASEC